MFPAGLLLKADNTSSNNLTFFVCLLSGSATSTHCCFPIDQPLSFTWVLLLVCECTLSACFFNFFILFFFRTDIPCCAFPGFGLFLLFTLCCQGDGEITDVKSWNLGPQETFIIVLCMKWALVPRFCRASCLFYKRVTNEDSSLMNNMKLCFTPMAHFFDNSK